MTDIAPGTRSTSTTRPWQIPYTSANAPEAASAPVALEVGQAAPEVVEQAGGFVGFDPAEVDAGWEAHDVGGEAVPADVRALQTSTTPAAARARTTGRPKSAQHASCLPFMHTRGPTAGAPTRGRAVGRPQHRLVEGGGAAGVGHVELRDPLRRGAGAGEKDAPGQGRRPPDATDERDPDPCRWPWAGSVRA
jgi:hypothetical protein